MIRIGLVAALVLGLAACSSKPKTNAVEHPSGPVLYDRIGRMDVIRAVVDDVVAAMAKDTRLGPRFTNVNLAVVAESMSIQLCELSGGPCKYTGRSMSDAHAELGVGEEDWSAFVVHLRAVLAKHRIGELEQKQVLEIVSKLHGDIVVP